jgi:site-specific recombinase XerD
MLAEIERFVNWVRRRSPNAHTWQDYRCDLNFFLESVGDRPPNAITFREVDQFICEQVEKGFKPTTINRRLASITSLYIFLMPEDDGLACPVFPRRHHLREPQRLPRPAPVDELRAFFAAIEDIRDLAIFTLMLRCGMRISEVAHLQLSDLHLDEDYPRMVVQGKGSRQRAVYVSPQAERALRLYLSIRPAASCEFVFLSYQLHGLSTHAIHMRLVRYRQQSGVNLTAHRLRHSFANDLLNVDVPVTSIQKLMGHRWIETTQTYVMANDRQVREDYFAASQKLEGWSSHERSS